MTLSITTQADTLREALAQTVSARGDGGGFEYLSHVLLETVDDSTMRLTSSDSVLTVEQAIAATNVGAPSVALRTETLKALMNNGLADEVVLEITLPGPAQSGDDDDTPLPPPLVKLKNGRRRYNIPAIREEHFAKDDRFNNEPLNVDAVTMADAIKKVAYAANENDVRPLCQGVSVMPYGVYATDGLRVALFDMEVPIKPEAGFVIPQKQAIYMAKHMSNKAQLSLQFDTGARPALFEVSGQGVTLRTRLIAGAPADVTGSANSGQFFQPADAAWSASFVAAECAAALSRITAMMGKRFGTEIKPQGGLFNVEIEDGQDEFAAEIEGEATSISLNPRYILDALSSLGGGSLFLYGQPAGKNLRPVLLCNKEQNELHYIQQMR